MKWVMWLAAFTCTSFHILISCCFRFHCMINGMKRRQCSEESEIYKWNEEMRIAFRSAMINERNEAANNAME